MEELVERFDIGDVHKAGGVFDVEKLLWMNAHYISTMETEALYGRLDEHLKEYEADFYASTWKKFPKEYHKKILQELQSKLKKLDEYVELTRFLYNEPTAPDLELFINEKMGVKTATDCVFAITFFCLALEEVPDTDDLEAMKTVILAKIKESGHKNGQILWPIRVALSSESYSPGAFELVRILGREKSIERLQKNLVKLQKIG